MEYETPLLLSIYFIILIITLGLATHCMHVYFYLLVFQIWMVSSSTLCFSACSSRKSKKYLTAGGTTAPEHSTLRKKSSTNCCSVPWNEAESERRDGNIKTLETFKPECEASYSGFLGISDCLSLYLNWKSLLEKHNFLFAWVRKV